MRECWRLSPAFFGGVLLFFAVGTGVLLAADEFPISIAEVKGNDGRTVNQERKSNQKRVTVHLDIDRAKGKAYRAFANGVALKKGTLSSSSTDSIALNLRENGKEIPDGPVELKISVYDDKDQEGGSARFNFILDTTGPRYVDHRLIGTPGGNLQLQVIFREDDLGGANPSGFKLYRTYGTTVFSEVESPLRISTAPIVEKNALYFNLNALPTDTYKFAILGPGESGDVHLRDMLGNPVEQAEFTFVSYPERQKGEHVPYPRFLRPGKDGPKQESFDPGDRVDTRVIRLFYYRDAHKVVEIINRDAKHLNAAGVDRDKFMAQEARLKAQKLTDERRFAEVTAVQAVTKAREFRQQIEDRQRELSLIANDAVKPGMPPYQGGEDKAAAMGRIQRKIQELQESLQAAQVREIEASNNVVKLQAEEDRAVEEQFRREVAAAKADYDTYAKGNVTSFDPVTQCTLAVIGEGLIQVRGPIKGINKIARIVHQIDVPVGQVKVGIHTVQINGEHGDRMEYVYEKIDRHIAHCRFLTNVSLQLFRKAVMKVASQVALEVDYGTVPAGFEPKPGAAFDFKQLTRDMKYIYSFFGKDFIDELVRMDSELLRSDNKLLSLNSMDTISLAGAMLLTALAKNDVRERIMQEFQALVQAELPPLEVDYLRALTTIRHHDPCVDAILKTYFQDRLDCKDARKVYERASRTYKFSNLMNFFGDQIAGSDTLNSVQHATLRMAQALKAQLVAEIEFNNQVLERSLLEKSEGEIVAKARDSSLVVESLDRTRKKYSEAFQNLSATMGAVIASAARTFKETLIEKCQTEIKQIRKRVKDNAQRAADEGKWQRLIKLLDESFDGKKDAIAKDVIHRFYDELLLDLPADPETAKKYKADIADRIAERVLALSGVFSIADSLAFTKEQHEKLQVVLEETKSEVLEKAPTLVDTVMQAARRQRDASVQLRVASREYEEARKDEQAYNKQLFAKRLLDQMIDEQEQKSVELLEAMRSHVSNVDNYLKRMAIALEDDVMAQFYNPAFQMVRRASRFWDVTLSQVETTTILTNNRAFAKVLPTATMEFDLPRRDIFIKEGLQGAKALALTYGELLRDPTFLAATSMLSGTPKMGEPNNIMQPFTLVNGQPPQPRPTFGSALDALIPPPEVYKFETGTGFEIRPVIQPDGQSILYNFNYMYTTNVREPVRADEKHLGRIKRHFIHTDVQTGSYELRELSRYVVSLKASRTAKGVPLLQDIPGVGILFRPLPSEESSLQENIILASSTIYPTTFELMGLRWSPYGDELNSPKLAKQKEIHLKRKEEMRNELLSSVRVLVNERIGIENKGVQVEETPAAPLQPIQPEAPFPPIPAVPHGKNWVPAPKMVPMDSKTPSEKTSPPKGTPATGPSLQTTPPKQDQSSLQKKDVIRAQGPLESSTPRNPQLAAAFLARATEHLNKKDFDRALFDCCQAVQLDPRSTNALCLRGLAWYFYKEYDRALADFQTAIQLDPNCANAYLNRAMVYYVKKEFARSIADSTRALSLEPNQARALYNRYLAHQACGKLEEARADYEAAVALDPRLAAR